MPAPKPSGRPTTGFAHEFTEQRCAGLDGLLVVDPEISMTRLRWSVARFAPGFIAPFARIPAAPWVGNPGNQRPRSVGTPRTGETDGQCVSRGEL